MMGEGNSDKTTIVNKLKQFLPNFEHIETGKALIKKCNKCIGL